MKKIVISGATGAIGTALIQKCIEENVSVLVLCRTDSQRRKNIPAHPLVKVLDCGLASMKHLNDISETGYDVFYHFAWASTIGSGRNDMYLQLKNVEYTLDAVHLAHRLGCTAFIGAGSQAEYGRYTGTLSANTPVFPETGYGMAKLCAGQMSRYECHELGMRHIWARILSVYGPNDSEQTMISQSIRSLFNGQKPSFTKGEQQWDYLYSSDAANALFLLGQRGIDGKTYCIGSGNARPLSEYIYQLRDAIAPAAEVGIGDLAYGENQVMYLCADIADLQKDTGFMPEVTFEEGIRKTIQSVKTAKDKS